jgi:hypothetical protein
LDQNGVATDVSVADLSLRIQADADIGVASVDAPDGSDRLKSVRYSFWFAWFALKRTIPDNIRAGNRGDEKSRNDPTAKQSPGGA